MIRQTSVDCYNQIKSEGLLSERRLEAYEALMQRGEPSTSSEVLVSMGKKTLIPQIRARLNELRELGAIYEKEERKCKITGRNAIVWDLTDNTPQVTIIRKRKRSIIKKEVIEMIVALGNILQEEVNKAPLRKIYKTINDEL